LCGPWKRAFSAFAWTVSRWSCYKIPKGSAFGQQRHKAALSSPFSGCGIQGLIHHLGIAGGPINLQLKYLATDAFDTVVSHIRIT
jgi:hypothetical protein